MTSRIDAILDFWFGRETDPGQPRKIWFEKDVAFDDAIRDRFLADYERATAGTLADWHETPCGALALVIALDQFPRNMFRGDPRCYASDDLARKAARKAIADGHDRALLPVQRSFIYLPFEHSEEIDDQRLSVDLMAANTDHPTHEESMKWVRRHLEIVERFGRFPHRNDCLGRTTTPEEASFLEEPNSSF